jgi:hypothetical protein
MASSAVQRYASYEDTMTAASFRTVANEPISYEEALTASRLPPEPPGYHAAVNEWPYRYPERPQRGGMPSMPAPAYPHEEENAQRRQREADPSLQPPPTYAHAIAEISRTFERDVDRYFTGMRSGLLKEFLLPLPSEADVSQAGGSYADRGRSMARVRSTRLARQAALLQMHQRELARLPGRIQRLGHIGADPAITDRLDRAYRRAVQMYQFFENEHKSLARVSKERAPMASLHDGDIPFHRWRKTPGEDFLCEAINLYARMQTDLVHAFSTPLPQVRGLQARILLPRPRRNELRYERSRRLEQQGELLADYFGRVRQLGERRMREDAILGAGESLLEALDETLDEMIQFLMPFRIEHHRQLRR